jgi:hypothetical protein
MKKNRRFGAKPTRANEKERIHSLFVPFRIVQLRGIHFCPKSGSFLGRWSTRSVMSPHMKFLSSQGPHSSRSSSQPAKPPPSSSLLHPAVKMESFKRQDDKFSPWFLVLCNPPAINNLLHQLVVQKRSVLAVSQTCLFILSICVKRIHISLECSVCIMGKLCLEARV